MIFYAIQDETYDESLIFANKARRQINMEVNKLKMKF